MSGVFVIVDDQDPAFRFSQGWGPTTAENSFEFGATMTGPGPQGATASYDFNGTSISVFYRSAANPNNTTTTFNFVIDHQFVNSTVVQADRFEHFHEKMFSSPPLAEGPHTLDITLTNITSPDIFLDYLIYEASPNSTLDGGGRLLVLDTSPYLAYSQGWSPGIVGLRPGLLESVVSLNNSVEGAADMGATVAFNFTGIAFEVRGLLVSPFPSAVASYSLDGGAWTDVQMPFNVTDYFNAVSNFEFIGQTFNEVGTHSLVITPLIPGAFFLDYIIVQSPTASFPQKAAIVAPPSSTSSTSNAGPSSSSVGPSSKANRAGLQAGPIAGIAAGCVCLAISFLAWFLLHRRRSQRRIHGTDGTPSAEDGGASGTTRPRSEMTSAGITAYTILSAQPWSKSEREANIRRENIATTTVPPAYSLDVE
ncbi:hypothetical protein DFH09DRAFT_1284006 [Mycena vulgaris]|nr:hypothetical protein DFH09DRAFT_1284006 [Mycena vulgaris]